MKAALGGALLAAALLLGACGEGEATLTIAAASDLAGALDELAPIIEEACRVRPEFVLGSSGQLRDQVRAGAPFDLYLSADRDYPRDLEATGDIQAGSVRDYARGRLALAWRDGLAPLASLDDLARPEVTRIALANPDHAPYGRAAREALQSAGLWDALQARLVIAENVRQAAEYVRSGDADAGLVALSLLVDPPRQHALVEAERHAPLVQSGGVVARAPHSGEARCALEVLHHAEGQAVLQAYGFEPVE